MQIKKMMLALGLGFSLVSFGSIADEKSADDAAEACVKKHHAKAPEWVDCVAHVCEQQGCDDQESALVAAKACHEEHPGSLEKLVAACYKDAQK